MVHVQFYHHEVYFRGLFYHSVLEIVEQMCYNKYRTDWSGK